MIHGPESNSCPTNRILIRIYKKRTYSHLDHCGGLSKKSNNLIFLAKQRNKIGIEHGLCV